MISRASLQPLLIELTSSEGPTKVVRVSGAARMDSGNELRDRLMGLIDGETRRLVLDLTDLEFINSMGLGGIVAAHLRLRSANSEIMIAAPRPEIRELLNVTRLVKLFPVHDTVGSALAAS